MNFFTKAKAVLTEPTKFFQGLKKEKSLLPSFLYFVVWSAITTVLGVAMYFLLRPIFTAIYTALLGKAYTGFSTPIYLLIALASYLAELIFSFVVVGIIHVWILIFGGKNTYVKTYQLVTYANTPRFVFAWIPFIGFFSWIYGLVLIIIGTQHVHGVSKTKSLLMYLIPVGLMIVLVLFVCVIALIVLSSLASSSLATTGSSLP